MLQWPTLFNSTMYDLHQRPHYQASLVTSYNTQQVIYLKHKLTSLYQILP